MNKNLVLLILLLIILVNFCDFDAPVKKSVKTVQDSTLRLYWFVPDGMRADPDLFNIYGWAESGELPNIKRMMDRGSYGYSVPVFPSHTPTNFATLLTGTFPEKHGVADGPMHVEGQPLNKVAIGGFSSAAKKVDPIWTTLERNGLEVLLLSMPGSTPPELEKGITVRGRWGGWGADFHALNFESTEDLEQKRKQGRGSRLFYFGPQLTQYVAADKPGGWVVQPKSYARPKEIRLDGWGSTLFAYIYDSTDDRKINYDQVIFSTDKKARIGPLKEGEWSDWIPLTLEWGELNVESHVKCHVIKLEDDGFFRIRLFYNNLNDYNVEPMWVSGDLVDNVGPMVDFVDNFPPQLIYYGEDKQTFLQEMHLSFDWHTRSIPFVIRQYDSNVIIHDIYSPNQMLTSRWWLGYVDPKSRRYGWVWPEEREQLWDEVLDMYKSLDTMIGQILDNSDKNTIIVLSSDHGAVPLDRWVRLNNLFAEKDWLHFEINVKTGEPIIDWDASQVIYLKMDNIYIHPDGLGGNWTRASGYEYDKLRKEVSKALLELEDVQTGVRPVRAVTPWEDVSEYLDLPTDRVGDLVITNEAGYGWNEEMTADHEIFSEPLKSGYKQAIFANETRGMWTPFIITGPGVKKGFQIEEPIGNVDQYPTILHLMGIRPPHEVDGRLLKEILD